MVKPARKSPTQRHHRKPPVRPIMTATQTDNAAIDALFDDFARNLARKIAGSSKGTSGKTKDGNS